MWFDLLCVKGLQYSGGWYIVHKSKATQIGELQLVASYRLSSLFYLVYTLSGRKQKSPFNWQTNTNPMQWYIFFYLLLFKTLFLTICLVLYEQVISIACIVPGYSSEKRTNKQHREQQKLWSKNTKGRTKWREYLSTFPFVFAVCVSL